MRNPIFFVVFSFFLNFHSSTYILIIKVSDDFFEKIQNSSYVLKAFVIFISKECILLKNSINVIRIIHCLCAVRFLTKLVEKCFHIVDF